MAGFSDLVAASAESLLTQDLRVRAGTTWHRGWTFYDDSNVLVDFTGGTATFKIKSSPNGTELTSFTHTLSGGKQVVLSNGTVSLSASSGATAGFATSENYYGVYEIQVTKGGETVSLVTGKITIYPSV